MTHGTRRSASRGCCVSTPNDLEAMVGTSARIGEVRAIRKDDVDATCPHPVVMVRAYEMLSEAGDWPLHLGVTEAGPRFQGTIKSSVAFGALLSRDIGDTIRLSPSAPPVEEVIDGPPDPRVAHLKPCRLEVVSCPACGRAQVDVYTFAEQVTARPREYGGPGSASP